MKHRYLYTQLLFLVTLMFTGCVKRELEFPTDTSLRIAFDWSRLADKQDIPSVMQLIFYDENGAYLFSRHSSSDFYQEKLPSGTYRILIYNPDATGVAFNNITQFDEARISTLSQQGGKDDDNQLEAPHNVYGASIGNLTIHPYQPADTTIIPRLYVHNIILRLKITGNTQELASCSASIGGVSGSLNLSTGIPASGDNASVTGNLYPRDNLYKGLFYVIGNDEQHKSMLSVHLRFSDGSERTLLENVTDSMEQLKELEKEVPLIIEATIDVKLVDGVFVATLEEWTYKTGEVTVS